MAYKLAYKNGKLDATDKKFRDFVANDPRFQRDSTKGRGGMRETPQIASNKNIVDSSPAS